MSKHFEFGCKYCGQVSSSHIVTVDGQPSVRCLSCGTCNFNRDDVAAATKRAERTFNR